MQHKSETYVDGFVIPIPTQNLDAYQKMALVAAEVWKEHGALDYRETVLEDGAIQGVRCFHDLAQAKEDETVVFAYIVFKDRAHRDEVNAKVMNDPRIKENCPNENPNLVMPFDGSRMSYSGFKTIVE